MPEWLSKIVIEGIKKMIYVVQLFLFCGLFTALVAIGTGGRAINEILFLSQACICLGIGCIGVKTIQAGRFSTEPETGGRG